MEKVYVIGQSRNRPALHYVLHTSTSTAEEVANSIFHLPESLAVFA